MNGLRRLISISAIGILSLSYASSQPKLDLIGGTGFDFGEIWTPTAKKLLTLRNRGNDTLIISNVSASCGCTGALISHDHIAPGDSGLLSITFDASRFGGKVEKFISFESNDTSQKHITITFHANVNKTLDFEPGHFYFSTYPDSLVTKEVTIANSSSATIHILKLQTSSTDFIVSSSATEIGPGEHITLTGSISIKQTGTFRGNVTIITDHPVVPRYTLNYFVLSKEKK